MENVDWGSVVAALFFLGSGIHGWRQGVVKAFLLSITFVGIALAGAFMGKAITGWMIRDWQDMAAGVLLLAALMTARHLLGWLLFPLQALAELPLISLVSRLAGAALGLVHGILYLWFLFFWLPLLPLGVWGERLAGWIGESTLLSIIYRFNLLRLLAERMHM